MTSTLVYLNIKQCFHIDRIHNEKCMNNHEPNLLAVNQAITHGGHAYKLHIYTLPHTPHVHTLFDVKVITKCYMVHKVILESKYSVCFERS